MVYANCESTRFKHDRDPLLKANKVNGFQTILLLIGSSWKSAEQDFFKGL